MSYRKRLLSSLESDTYQCSCLIVQFLVLFLTPVIRTGD